MMYVPKSVVNTVARKVAELKKDNTDVINLCIGDPKWYVADHIKLSAIKAVMEGMNGYPPIPGFFDLRSAIVDKVKSTCGVVIDTSEVLVSAGARQCIYLAFLATLEEGDDVIVCRPYWPTYIDVIKLLKCNPVVLDCDDDMIPRLDLLKGLITSRTKWIMLNSPNNPSGSIYSKEFFYNILSILEGTAVKIMNDEVYDGLCFSKEDEFSILSLKGVKDVDILCVNGFSKAYALAGWRIGYCVGSSSLISDMIAAQTVITGGANGVAQYACTTALQSPRDLGYVKSLKAKKDLFMSFMRERSYVKCFEPKASFFALIDIRSFNISDIDFAERFLDEFHVATIPGSECGCDGFIRVVFDVSEQEMIEFFQRLDKMYAISV